MIRGLILWFGRRHLFLIMCSGSTFISSEDAEDDFYSQQIQLYSNFPSWRNESVAIGYWLLLFHD